MKRLFGKRFHRVPIALVSALLVVVLIAGGALAVNGYPFFTGTIQVQVEEPIALGEFSTWDNLVPYGSDSSAVWEREEENWYAGTLGDVSISLGVDEENENPMLAIATVGTGDKVGSGFSPGEWIVIPLNIRNGGGGSLILSATVDTSGGLEVEHCWLTNIDTGGEIESHPDGDLNRDFRPEEGTVWAPLGEWSETIEEYGGESGSARLGAQVLFVRIRAPGNAEPGIQDLDIILYRN